MPAKLTTVSLSVGHDPTVLVDGVEIPEVETVRVDHTDRRELPVVYVGVRTEEVDVAGLSPEVRIQTAPSQAAEDLVRLLDGLDPEQLDRDMLAELSLGDGGGKGGAAAMIATIRRYLTAERVR